MIQWILDEEDYYQRDISGLRQYELDIRELSTATRYRILEFMRHPRDPRNPPNILKIGLKTSDRLAPRRNICLYIPKSTSHIDLCIVSSLAYTGVTLIS